VGGGSVRRLGGGRVDEESMWKDGENDALVGIRSNDLWNNICIL